MPWWVLLIILAGLNGWADFKKAKAQVAWEREMIKKDCESEHPPDNYVAYGYCSDGRYGVPRRWWERKTYQEMLKEMENSGSVKENKDEN